ncbi:hypothetical protein GGR42_000179 [Saonia flava]|uniref:Uncharacterized protein n=1 Tax=Saonia flava TaxID=523696 RepID=A0A846QRA5_9FLAO|nr:hypothetical protein [Saonia flava]NJB69717.1 hypothetical protein [Saonia flava]
MPTQENTVPKPFLQTLSMLHLGLFTGLVAFTGFAYYTGDSLKTESYPNGDVFLYLVPIGAIVGYFFSQFMFQKMVGNIPQKRPLQSKLARYQSASLIKYAILEAPAFLALFAFLQDSHALYLTIVVSLIVYFFTQRPTEDKIKKHLHLR